MKKLWKVIEVICAIFLIGGVIAGAIDLYKRRKMEKKAKKTCKNIHKTYGAYERYFKRFLDVFLSGIALVGLSPVMIVTAILVRKKLGSPVLFIQERPGKDEKIFKLYKFRTMTNEKDENGDLLSDEKRLHPFGEWLRSTSLDELPELINIIKGDMSIVGPRPQLVRDMVFMTKEQRRRHSITPGLTGLAQVNGRNIISWEEKLALDLKYVDKISLLEDIKIILQTVNKAIINKEDITMKDMATAMDFGEYLLNKGEIEEFDFQQKQELAEKILADSVCQ